MLYKTLGTFDRYNLQEIKYQTQQKYKDAGNHITTSYNDKWSKYFKDASE